MELRKISDEVLRKARKGGFKAKAPKRPKMSASANTLLSYISRYNNWVAKANEASKKLNEKDNLKKKIFGRL
jgi:hypothetical protein